LSIWTSSQSLLLTTDLTAVQGNKSDIIDSLNWSTSDNEISYIDSVYLCMCVYTCQWNCSFRRFTLASHWRFLTFQFHRSVMTVHRGGTKYVTYLGISPCNVVSKTVLTRKPTHPRGSRITPLSGLSANLPSASSLVWPGSLTPDHIVDHFMPLLRSLLRWRSGVSHLLQCAWPVWPPCSGGQGSTPGSGGLSVHAVQLSAFYIKFRD